MSTRSLFVSMLLGVGVCLTATTLPSHAQAVAVSAVHQATAAALVERGNDFYQRGDVETAIAFYTTAIERDPNSVLAYVTRAGAYGGTGDYDAAIADYNSAIAIDSNAASAYGGRGYARYRSGDTDAGIADLWDAALLFRKQARMDAYHETLGVIRRLDP
ncbi:MAG: tetratricopeptide repeat protein [Cyanobacteria bacterium P01_A01_bin.123]